MDGLKRRLNDSLQLRLSFWLSAAIVLVAALAGVFSFVSAFHGANELQDNTLRQVAALFDRQALPAIDGAEMRGSDEETRVVVQHLTDKTRAGDSGDTRAALPLRADLPDGLQTVEIEGEAFRVLVKTTRFDERIAVAQETGVRNEIARDGALRTVLPFMGLVPLLLWLLANLVRKMFRPISALSAALDQRSDEDLYPMDTDSLPAEVRPFAAAINRLLGRVERSMKAQRRFVADAAHELRSPFTALSLQAERLAQLPLGADASERLHTLRGGIERGSRLLEQLLTLARAQETMAPSTANVSVGAVVRRVLEDMVPLAQVKDIDLGIVGSAGIDDIHIPMDEIDLVTLVRNLVDNAVRYTPPGGKVDLSTSTSEGTTVLQIDDSGPGIAPSDRVRVFEPFCRLQGSEQTGSGLGLSIVQAIVLRTGATIALDYADSRTPSGLRVQVRMPQRAGAAR